MKLPPNTKTSDVSLICIVDDDLMVRESIRMLCVAHDYQACAYADCQSFLDAPERAQCACLILDVRLPGISGPELQERLLADTPPERIPPIIFISGHGTLPLAVKAMRLGALDFLQKPFNDGDLLERVAQAVEKTRQAQTVQREKSALAERLNHLSPREKEVLDALEAGLGNKQIADQMGISIRTVEQHRANLKAKLKSRNLPDLLKKARTGTGAPDE